MSRLLEILSSHKEIVRNTFWTLSGANLGLSIKEFMDYYATIDNITRAVYEKSITPEAVEQVKQAVEYAGKSPTIAIVCLACAIGYASLAYEWKR